MMTAGLLSEKSNRRKTPLKRIVVLTVKYVVMGVIAVFLLFPYYFMVSKSLMSITEINSVVPTLFPESLKFSNYRIVGEYFGNIVNSLVICVINGIFVPLTAMMVAYPYARHNFPGKKAMFAVMMSTVLLPGAVLSVPTYIMFSAFGLVDTVASQWVTAFWGGGAMNTFLFMQFMRVLPRSYDEAAVIDGANKYQIFVHLIVPLCKNIFIYIAIGTVMARWQDFQGPLIYLVSKEKFTVAVAFYYDFSSNGASSMLGHYRMAMAVIMTILPAVLYFAFQNQMVGSIQIGGIKE